MGNPVVLSTSSVYPGGVADTFRTAAELGYDGVEVMVWREAPTRDAEALLRLVDMFGVPVVSVHAPTLLVSQGVWGRQPWEKVDRSLALAQAVDAPVVVVHPPFRWQWDYARDFVAGVAERESRSRVRLSVENMFPWKVRTRNRDREVLAYRPGWDPVENDYASVTLDLSHTATAGSDPLEMARRLGDRLAHVHLADGTGTYKDEHLVPGAGTQPCAELLRVLPEIRFTGSVAVEVNTRRMAAVEREAALAASLSFARHHLTAVA